MNMTGTHRIDRTATPPTLPHMSPAACETQQSVYDKWKSTDEREWFSDMKYCIDDASCAEIADGECYDDELYIW